MSQLDAQQVSLASAFSEPLYERFRWRSNHDETQLLAFVRSPPETLRTFLQTHGAKPSDRLDAKCYQEVWEIPSDQLSRFPMTLLELDQSVAGFLRVVDGKYPASAGYWFLGDAGQTAVRKRSTSRLLQSCLQQGPGPISR